MNSYELGWSEKTSGNWKLVVTRGQLRAGDELSTHLAGQNGEVFGMFPGLCARRGGTALEDRRTAALRRSGTRERQSGGAGV